MPTRDKAINGAPCWIELDTSDVARSRAFYSELFGWTSEEPNPDFGGYFNFNKGPDGGARIAGGMATPEGMPDVWSIYLATDDIKRTLDDARTHGGQVLLEAMPVADLGIMGFLADPTGAAIGVWQPGQHQGFGLVGEHGAPGWFELHTREYDKALDFYRAVFGWQTQVEADTDEFRYTTLVHDGEQHAGVMDASAFLPEGVPAHWSVYFAVDDTDAAIAKIGELGGATVMPAEDTPYGRLAVVTDPVGVQFKLVGPNDQMPAS